MPGETKIFAISIGDAAQGEGVSDGVHFSFQEVPPPKDAPLQTEAEDLGLVKGLRVEESRHGQWRCCECSAMQPSGSLQVWVPDGVRKRDPDWSVTEACRVNAWNGSHSAWCVRCAPKAQKKRMSETENSASLPWWKKLFQ